MLCCDLSLQSQAAIPFIYVFFNELHVSSVVTDPQDLKPGFFGTWWHGKAIIGISSLMIFENRANPPEQLFSKLMHLKQRRN